MLYKIKRLAVDEGRTLPPFIRYVIPCMHNVCILCENTPNLVLAGDIVPAPCGTAVVFLLIDTIEYCPFVCLSQIDEVFFLFIGSLFLSKFLVFCSYLNSKVFILYFIQKSCRVVRYWSK